MMFKTLILLGLAACALAEVIPVPEDQKDGIELTELTLKEVEELEAKKIEEHDEGSSSEFWNTAFNMLKKDLRIEPLKCLGASCSSCLEAFGKGGCFKVAYNRLPYKRAEIFMQLLVNNRPRWTGRFNAGRFIPSCVNFHGHIKVVCLEDFTCSVGEKLSPKGDICFTINFKNYKLGVNFCVTFEYGSFIPIVHPSIKKT